MDLDAPRRVPMPLQDRHDADPPVTHLKVINRNTFPIEDRYNGEIFVFAPNSRVTVPREVASHIFGVGLPEQEQLAYCMRRFGWNIPALAGDQFSQSKMYFQNITITPVYMRLVEVQPEPDFPEPRRAPGRPQTKSRYKAPGIAAGIPGDDDEDPEDKPAA